MSDTRLLLIRHGLIKANVTGHWHGSTDSPLTWRGKRQARRLARRLRTRDIRAVYASPLVRSIETARPVAKLIGAEVRTEPGLAEWSLGVLEQVHYDTLASAHEFYALTTRDLHYAPHQGESVGLVADRMIDTLRRIHDAHEGEVAIISHGAAMAVAIAALLDADPTQWTNYSFANCSITELVLEPEPHLHRYNEV